jgi:hypothetical protein
MNAIGTENALDALRKLNSKITVLFFLNSIKIDNQNLSNTCDIAINFMHHTLYCFFKNLCNSIYIY